MVEEEGNRRKEHVLDAGFVEARLGEKVSAILVATE